MHFEPTSKTTPPGDMIPVHTEESLAGAAEMQDRANTYVALGALFAAPANDELLSAISSMEPVENPETQLELAWEMLRKAALSGTRAAIDDEYHDLFIGVGRGEVVPYGSWHLTGFLMEKPLGLLRADLRNLGFERREDVPESEDHIAALCQVMAAIITSDDIDFATQRKFFNDHLASWVPGFLDVLQQASSADFYRAVGNLGQSFFSVESQYLSMPV